MIHSDFGLQQTLDSIALLERTIVQEDSDRRNDKPTADFLNQGTRDQIAKLKAEVAA